MKTYDETMSAVTGAVLKAEGSLKDAIVHYRQLVKAEQAIVDHPDASDDDKRIARNGVLSAQRILGGIRAVFDWEPES